MLRNSLLFFCARIIFSVCLFNSSRSAIHYGVKIFLVLMVSLLSFNGVTVRPRHLADVSDDSFKQLLESELYIHENNPARCLTVILC